MTDDADDMLDAMLRHTDCERVSDLAEQIEDLTVVYTNAEGVLALAGILGELIATCPFPPRMLAAAVRLVERYLAVR